MKRIALAMPLVSPLTETCAALRAFPRSAWILFFGTFINRFGSFVVPFLALYMTRQGFSVAQASLAMSAYGFGHLLASAIGGYLADRIGRRKTIALSMFSVAVTMLLLSQARSAPVIILLAGLAGLTGELYRPASSALLADLTPAGQRVTAFAGYRLALNAGWAFGPATAGFLAKKSFFWLFLGDALTSAAFGIVALLALPHGIRSKREESGWGDALKHTRHDRPFLQLLAGSWLVGLVFFQMSSTFGLQVTELGFSPATYGLLISLNGVLVVLFELPITSITRRLPARGPMTLGYALVGVGFAMIAFANDLRTLTLACAVFTFGEIISMPVASAHVADLAPVSLRGRYMGLFGFTWAFALMIGPGMGMIIFGRNPQALWLACGLVGLLAAWIVSRKITRHE
jgi:MFS family permease